MKHAINKFDANEKITSFRTESKENHRIPCTARFFVQKSYERMRSRIKHKKNYQGLNIMTKQEFYDWAYESLDFHKLWLEYKNEDYYTPLAPSPDRRDDSKGYTLDNVQWITWEENEKKGKAKWLRKREEYYNRNKK